MFYHTEIWKLTTQVDSMSRAEWETVSSSPLNSQMSLNRPGSMPMTWISFMWQSETCSGTRWDMLHQLSGTQTQQLPMWEIQHLTVKNEVVWIFCVSMCFLTHTHLDQYEPQSSSIQGLVSLQGLNISWKQKEKIKRPWTVVLSECLGVSIWLDNGTALLSPIKIAWALYMFCFHRNSWEN